MIHGALKKWAAGNERFHASGGVTPLKATCEYERKYPAERLVKAAADAKPPAVVCKRRERGGESRKNLNAKHTL